MVWDIPFLMFAGFCGRITTIISEERSAARIYTINAIANVALNAIFIPIYGMIGAAVVSVLTDIISALQFYIVLRNKLATPKIQSQLARIILASVIMGLTIWVTGGFHLFLRIGIGALIYIVLVLVLRIFDDTEWDWIRESLKKLTGL
jgi:O-antigen/teichoic acid export membrane protein